MTAEEWRTRCDLAAAYRLIADYGWGSPSQATPCGRNSKPRRKGSSASSQRSLCDPVREESNSPEPF